MDRVARLSSGFSLAVTVLAWLSLLATPPFLVWVVMRSTSTLAEGVTVPVSSLPLLPILVYLVLYSARSLLVAVVLFSLRRILRHFGQGRFFTRDCVGDFRRVGLQLLALASIDVLGPILTGLALLVAEPRFDPPDAWLMLTNFPLTAMVGGLFALILAHILGRAADMAEDAALTV